MKIDINDPPRTFSVGWKTKIELQDCAHLALRPNEQVTFTTEDGAEYDVARKEWGFYASPSLNGRLPRFNLRPVLVKNRVEQYFLLLVEKEHEASFMNYRESEQLQIIAWLDDAPTLQAIESSQTRRPLGTP